jgi:hypothetical protein
MELVLYDEMRLAIERCCQIDEAANIRDAGAKLAAYARIRDDSESERRFAEIRLRAIRKIGEISRDLEKAEHGGSGGGSKIPPMGTSKEQQLAEVGISTSSAHAGRPVSRSRDSLTKYTSAAALAAS